MAGGTPLEFNAFHVTDGEAEAGDSMRYVLPSRELIADLVELMVRGHGIDAVVMLPSGDKVVPGMLMAAFRLDLPAIVLYGGPTPPGMYRGKKLFYEDVFEGVGKVKRGLMSGEELRQYEDLLFPGPGAVSTASTGNTLGMIAEALGLSLPHGSTLPAASNMQLRAAKYTGLRITELLSQGHRPSTLVTEASFENAIRAAMAVSGSLNMILHVMAIAREAGVSVTLETFDRMSRSTPTLVAISPSGPTRCEGARVSPRAISSRLIAASPVRFSACVSSSVSNECTLDGSAAPRSPIFSEPIRRNVGSWERRSASFTSS